MVKKNTKNYISIENLVQQIKKETSASKKTTSSISYRNLVSRRRPGAYCNKYGDSIKENISQQNGFL